MAMTPDEYASRELNVAGHTDGESLYAPGFGPNGQIVGIPGEPFAQPHNHHEPPASPGGEPMSSDDNAAMVREYHFTLPLQIRRAEAMAEVAKIAHLAARTRFWKSLAFSVLLAPLLAFVVVLVK